MRMRSSKLLLPLLVGLLIFSELKGQFYNMITYSLKDGLPEERLNCLMQDCDGYIWMGARFGLYKFNGKKFSTISLPITVRNKFVNHLLQDSKKRIWVCINGSGLVELEGTHARQILISPETCSMDFSHVTAATVNSINRIYEIRPDLFLVLTDEGVYLFDTNRFTPFASYVTEGIPPIYPSYSSAQIIHDSPGMNY